MNSPVRLSVSNFRKEAKEDEFGPLWLSGFKGHEKTSDCRLVKNLIFVNVFIVDEEMKMDEDKNSKNESLRNVLSHCEERSKYLGNLIRETIKYFTTIFSSLTTAAIAAKILVLHYGIERYIHCIIGTYQLSINLVNVMIASIEIIALIAVIIGLKDITRIYKVDLENNTILNKIRFCLGLYDEIAKERRFYEEDPYIFPTRFTKRDWKSSEDFVQEMMNWRKREYPLSTALGLFSVLFYIYIFSSMVLVIILLFV